MSPTCRFVHGMVLAVDRLILLQNESWLWVRGTHCNHGNSCAVRLSKVRWGASAAVLFWIDSLSLAHTYGLACLALITLDFWFPWTRRVQELTVKKHVESRCVLHDVLYLNNPLRIVLFVLYKMLIRISWTRFWIEVARRKDATESEIGAGWQELRRLRSD